MIRTVTAVTLALALLAVSATTAAAGSTDGSDPTYVRYAKVRAQVVACALDRNWRHLGPEKRKQCARLRRRYALYSSHGHPGATFIICKTRRCPPAPLGVPNPRGTAPRDAVRVYG